MAEWPYISLLENHPHVDQLITIQKKAYKQIATLYKMINSRFDVAIDLFGNPRSAMMTYLSGAHMRIGGDFRGRGLFYSHKIMNDNRPQTAVEFHLSYLKPLRIPIEKSIPKIVITSVEREWAENYLSEKGYHREKKIIGIHPGATWPAKMWFTKRFAELGNHLVQEDGFQVFYTIGPDDDSIFKEIMERSRFPVKKPKIMSLRKLAALISCFDLFISNDCGPMHLSPAVDTKTIGIFGPGEPEIWFPYEERRGHRIVHKEINCSRCHKDFCDTLECMKAISVDDVYRMVHELL